MRLSNFDNGLMYFRVTPADYRRISATADKKNYVPLCPLPAALGTPRVLLIGKSFIMTAGSPVVTTVGAIDGDYS